MFMGFVFMGSMLMGSMIDCFKLSFSFDWFELMNSSFVGSKFAYLSFKCFKPKRFDFE